YLELFDTGIGLAVRPHTGHGRAYRYGVYFFPSQLGVIKVYIVVHYIAILGGRPSHNGLAVLDAYAVQLYHIMVALVFKTPAHQIGPTVAESYRTVIYTHLVVYL